MPTVTLINNVLVQKGVEKISSTYSVPPDLTGEISLDFDMTEAALTDPDTSIKFILEMFIDLAWRHKDGSSYIGLPIDSPSWHGGSPIPPGITFNIGEVAGKNVRVRAINRNQNKNIRFGVDITY